MPKSFCRRWNAIKTQLVWSHCEVFTASDFSRQVDHAEPLTLLLFPNLKEASSLQRAHATEENSIAWILWNRRHSNNIHYQKPWDVSIATKKFLTLWALRMTKFKEKNTAIYTRWKAMIMRTTYLFYINKILISVSHMPNDLGIKTFSLCSRHILQEFRN